MGLFSASVTQKINQIAAKSTEQPKSVSNVNTRSMNDELNQISKQVIDYFQDSQAILITTKEQLHDYVDKCIENGYAGIDTETTGLDRINDWIVGASLYTPGMPECYIPMKHIVPIFDNLYKDQLTYEEVGEELRRFTEPKQVLSNECKVKLIFANADFDLAMIFKDLKADLIDAFYYDVITAWRCLKEDEMDNSLKGLYAKYVKKDKIDPKKFSDFFPVKLFPNCKPKVAALYAANDAKITYELFLWQLPYVTVTHDKCKKNHLEKIANLVWNIEFPMVRICAMLHRRGVYLDDSIASVLHDRYTEHLNKDKDVLAEEIQKLIDDKDVAANMKRPFRTGKDFNPNSNPHVKYLINNLLGSQAKTTGKDVLKELNKPSTKAVLDVRGDVKLLSTYVDKLPKATARDKRIHASFKSIGADTGRMCIAKGTLITVLNGQKKIEDIVPGDLVYCYDDDGNLHLSPVKNLWKTGENIDCVDICWKSVGRNHVTGHLICTPEHPIRKRDGSWCNAADLRKGDRLVHLRRTPGSAPDFRPELNGWNGLAIREQDLVKYDVFKCEVDPNIVVHHKDGDKSNNELSNLELMIRREHTRMHSAEFQRIGVLRHNYLHSTEVVARQAASKKHNHDMRIKAKRDDLINAIWQAKGNISQVPYDFDSFKRNCIIAGIDYEEECRKAGGIKFKYRKSSSVSKEEFLEAYSTLKGDYRLVTKQLNISAWTFYSKCKEYDLCRNHKVLSVTPAGRFDVYDIEVEDYHNFISNEICTHNSSEAPNMQNIPSHALDIRHMFRATPEQPEIISIDTDNQDLFSVTLSRWDTIPSVDTQILVNDLKEGNIVIFHKDKEYVQYAVSSIKFKGKDATIIFKKGEFNEQPNS